MREFFLLVLVGLFVLLSSGSIVIHAPFCTYPSASSPTPLWSYGESVLTTDSAGEWSYGQSVNRQ